MSILKGVLEKYPDINSNEILTAAGIVIKKVKEHVYSSAGEPFGFLEATDQLALAFSSRYAVFSFSSYDCTPTHRLTASWIVCGGVQKGGWESLDSFQMTLEIFAIEFLP